jgi:hypothetical protein
MEKLKLGDIRIDLPFKVSRNCHFDWYETLILRKDVELDFDVYLPSLKMNLQRGFVWTLHQKQQFIISILKDNPIPGVSIIRYYEMEKLQQKKIEIIDGKQRMCAFIEFCENKFPLPSGHYFKDFDDDAKVCIYRFNSKMDCCTLYDETLPDKHKVMWFENINFTGTPQDEAHLEKLKQ